MTLERKRSDLERAAKLLCTFLGVGEGLFDQQHLAHVLFDLVSFVPERPIEGASPNTPFFTEAGLYALLGKEDAQCVLSRFNELLRALGHDPYTLEPVIGSHRMCKPIEIDNPDEMKGRWLERCIEEGRVVRADDGALTLTEVGEAWNVRAEEWRHTTRKVWGIEFKDGPNAGVRLHMATFPETLIKVGRLTGDAYVVLYEPDPRKGETEPVTGWSQ